MRYQEIILESFPLAKKEWGQSHDTAEVEQYIAKFRDLTTRNIIKGEQRDINYWRKAGYDAFKTFVEERSTFHSRKQVRKGKVSGKSLTLLDTAENSVLVPLSIEANAAIHAKYDLSGYCTAGTDGAAFSSKFGVDEDGQLKFLVFVLPKTKDGDLWILELTRFESGYLAGSFWDTNNQRDGYDEENDYEYSYDFYDVEKTTGITKEQITTAINQHIDEITEACQKFMRDDVRGRIGQTKQTGQTDDKLFNMILTRRNPAHAYDYAVSLNRRIPEFEPFIKKDPETAEKYARSLINGRWPEAEPYILTNAKATWDYVKNVIQGPWEQAESMFNASNAYYAATYAIEFGKKRLPLRLEKIVMTKTYAWDAYAKAFNLTPEDIATVKGARALTLKAKPAKK